MSAMNKVSEKLFLGNIKAASDIKSLKANVSQLRLTIQNITHILTAANGIKPFFPTVSKLVL